MKKDRIIYYSLELILIVFLIFTLFVENVFSKLSIGIVLIIYYVIVKKLLRKNNIVSISNSKQVKELMILLALAYVGMFYLVGIFVGYQKVNGLYRLVNLTKNIIPIIIIVIFTEKIRTYFLSYKIKYNNILTLIWTVLIDLLIYANVYKIATLSELLRVLGYILFSSISCNLLYNYLSKRYGEYSIIGYRLITILFVFIIPYTSNMYLYMRSFVRMVYPFVIYLIIEYCFAKTNFASNRKNRKANFISYGTTLAVMTMFIMLISCNFRYGILVIGSSSMTGTIDKGDVILFKSDKNEQIKVGDIIVFNKNDIRVVHRVIGIIKEGNDYKFKTKGDANDNEDKGTISKSELLGKVIFNIKELGKPTLWINEVFDNA